MANKQFTPHDLTERPAVGNAFELPFMSAFQPSSMLLGQRMALEGAQFWSKRMHALADQMKALARCDNPADAIESQTKFVKQLRDDYTTEAEAIKSILGSAMSTSVEAPQSPAHQ